MVMRVAALTALVLLLPEVLFPPIVTVPVIRTGSRLMAVTSARDIGVSGPNSVTCLRPFAP